MCFVQSRFVQTQLKQRGDVCDRLKLFYDKLEEQFANYLKVLPENIKSQITTSGSTNVDSGNVVKVKTEPNSSDCDVRKVVSNGFQSSISNHDNDVALSLDSSDS